MYPATRTDTDNYLYTEAARILIFLHNKQFICSNTTCLDSNFAKTGQNQSVLFCRNEGLEKRVAYKLRSFVLDTCDTILYELCYLTMILFT